MKKILLIIVALATIGCSNTTTAEITAKKNIGEGLYTVDYGYQVGGQQWTRRQTVDKDYYDSVNIGDKVQIQIERPRPQGGYGNSADDDVANANMFKTVQDGANLMNSK